ncbi:MAG: YfjI family protein, partial [Ruminococcus sp.]
LPIVKEEENEEPLSIPFPSGAFPPEIEAYLHSVAKHVQVDTAMVFPAALAAFALCLQGKYMVSYPSGNGHKEHLCLYLVIVADPGERKSAVFSAVNRPIREWQAEKRERYKLALAEYDTQKTILEGQRDSLKKKLSNKQIKPEERAATGDALTAATADLEALQPPISPEIIATDTTVEALADLMRLTGETAGVCSDEADFFKIIAGLYTGGQTGNLQLPLKAYDGTPFYLLRRGRTIGMQRPLLSICLMVQPSLFVETLGNSELKGRGMVGRLLTCTPKKMAGLRDVRSSEKLHEAAYQSYKETMLQFLDTEQKSDTEIPVLTWAADARERMLDYLQTVENSMQAGNPMEESTDYASKSTGVAIRIAGILHMLWTRDENKPISKVIAEKAIQVHTFFFSEKLKDMQQEESRENVLEKRVLGRIKAKTIQNGIAFIPTRAIHQSLRCTKELMKKENFDYFLQSLVAKNLIQIEEDKNRKSTIYVSPYVKS